MKNKDLMLPFDVQGKIIEVREQLVLLDRDVAALYGVETKRVNEAVKNNPERFPEGYVFQLDKQEIANLWSKISTSSWGGARYKPKYNKSFNNKPRSTQSTQSI